MSPSFVRPLTLALLGLCSLQCASPSRSGHVAVPPLSAQASGRSAGPAIEVDPAAARRIGQKIWENEAAGQVAGLTSWNRGEHFASLGIGHFIWYPAGVPHTYEESFPPLLAFLQARGIALPDGLTPQTPCPWPSREAFQAQQNSPRMQALRTFLKDTIPGQTEFIIQRLRAALPKMLAAAPAADRPLVAANFNALTKTPNGLFALIDYVNFKGEGVNPKERYQGQGWGLLQVLQSMRPGTRGQAAVAEFSAAAKRTLGRRIANAPKNESQWQTGWFRRCDSYRQPW